MRVVPNVLCHACVITTIGVSFMAACSAIVKFQLLTATNNTLAVNQLLASSSVFDRHVLGREILLKISFK
jgi:hypothetical protein